MFGLGLQEVILLALMAGGAAVVAVVLSGRSRGRSRDLEEENRRLRAELDRRDRG